MEMLNKIELQGIIGQVRTQEYTEGNICARFSLATNFAYQDREGGAVIETSWHSVSAWQGQIKGVDLTTLQMGDKVHVEGRIDYKKYVDANGIERQVAEIMANKINRIEL